MPRPKGGADLLEDRRKRALALLKYGLSLNEVGRRIGSSASSVMRWRDAWRRGGAIALKVRFSPGRPWKLGKRQRQRLIALLLKGAMAHGYRTNLWTTARIAEVIERKFGVRHHRDHVGRLMRSLKWSVQKPERHALERKEAEIKHWKKKEWPRIKKTLRGWAPTSFSPMNPASS
jgi:transposase